VGGEHVLPHALQERCCTWRDGEGEQLRKNEERGKVRSEGRYTLIRTCLGISNKREERLQILSNNTIIRSAKDGESTTHSTVHS
jgi:hypothetical protein